MRELAQEFLAQLGRGPAVLLLGQHHLAAETGTDPLLEQTREKFGLTGDDYHSLLDAGLEKSPDQTAAWIDERCQRVVPGTYLEKVASYPWSCVVSSAIDTVWPSAFRQPWRELQPIFDEQHRPADPRNRSRLHCLFLFGNVNRTDPRERVPLSRFQLLKRSAVATSLTQRIPEIVSPLGLLAIDGYRRDSDWLRSEVLYPALAELNPRQVHIFGATPELRADPILGELHRQEIVVWHSDSLGQVLAWGEEAGLVETVPVSGGDLHQIRLNDRIARIPDALWTRVRSEATVLDDSLLVQPQALSADALYRDFRSFLGAGDGAPSWDGLARGFAFKRRFETELQAAVEKALAAPGGQESPLILHGPTGSGKTIALASVARRVRLAHTYPVLFIERRAQQPSFGDIDLFCEWAEQEGAIATLVAWDGMRDGGEYHDAVRYLGSRGRNVVVVGTTYRQGDIKKGDKRYVEAPPRLSEEERRTFVEFLRGFDAGLDSLVSRAERLRDDSFLVALYRLLPPVRGVVRAGVTREVRHAENTMARASDAQAPEPFRARNALDQALRDAGLVASEGPSGAAEQRVGTEVVNDFQHLTGLVMVPGRFGLRVPLELLLRALGHEGFSNFLELMDGVDIFRWFEDPAGNLEIGPRSRLEATLIAGARTGGAETEAALVKELLLHLRPESESSFGGRDVEFGVGLLRAVGPGGEDPAAFADYFGSFAETLQQARLERGSINPRLMLQEANLRRESARDASTRRDVDFDFVDESLDAAEEVVRQALELLPDEQRNKTLRSRLLVELASAMGTRSTHLVKRGQPRPDEASATVTGLREVVASARREDPTSYHPVDVLAWTTRNAIDGGVLKGTEKLEALSEVMAAFQTTEVAELEPKQVTKFHARRWEIGSILGDSEITAESAQELRARGSGAALFLEALRASGLISSREGDAPPNLQAVEGALAILEAEQELLWADARCLDLYLDLWWTHKTGTPLFSGERLAPGLTKLEWEHLLRIIDVLEVSNALRRPAVLGFLRALAFFHLDRLADARTTFKEVERLSMAVRSRRRIIRTYLASTPSGQPRGYHGTVSWLDPSGRKGEVYVEELRQGVVFFSHDFRLDDPRLNLDLGEFRIAFNFLGPIADPQILRGGR